MKLKKRRHQAKTTTTQQLKEVDSKRPFIEHLLELRRRVFIVACSVLVFSTAAYFVQQSIVAWLLKPARGQHFIYTSPAGGIGFLFQICTYVGIILSLPVLVYQALKFLQPIINKEMRRFVIRSGIWSAILAVFGIGFGYVVGLPLALHFLGHQFTTSQISPLLTISEYMSFVTVYLLGSAMLFQLPLIMYIGNRIKPIKPSKLIKMERYVVVAAFVISMLMAPTINVFDQLIIALPILIAYQVGIALIWYVNRRPHRSPRVVELVQKDIEVQAERIRRAEFARSELRSQRQQPSSRTYTPPTQRSYQPQATNEYPQSMKNALVMR